MMRFLDKLELYIKEDTEAYDIVPVDFDEEHGVSFSVKHDDKDTSVANIVIKTIDGVPIDALGGGYKYDDVYADVKMDGDIDDPATEGLVQWITKKIKELGYDDNTIRIDGREVFSNDKNPISVDNEEGESEDELVQSDSDIDVTNYWDDGSEETTDTEDEEEDEEEESYPEL